MVPGMRIASAPSWPTWAATPVARRPSPPASWASRPSSACSALEVIRSLDGQESHRGRLARHVAYRGLLPLVDVGGEIDVSKLPATKTKVGLILADIGQSLFLSRLRTRAGLRGRASCAPSSCSATSACTRMALEAFDQRRAGRSWSRRQAAASYEGILSKVMKEQLATGLHQPCDVKLQRSTWGSSPAWARSSSLPVRARGHASGTDEVLAIHRRLRELDKKLDEHIGNWPPERLDDPQDLGVAQF